MDRKKKVVSMLEMSCPWMENRESKMQEKTQKYELKTQFKGFKIHQHNIILDVLGGYSKELKDTVRQLVGARSKDVLLKMQKSVLSNSLHIARFFNITTYAIQTFRVRIFFLVYSFVNTEFL